MRNIEVVVGEDGEIKIEAVNFKGAGCEKAVEFLKKALGIVVSSRRKPEFFIGNDSRQQSQQR